MPDHSDICLALDTALDACSVALALRGDALGHQTNAIHLIGRSINLGRGHAEHLMSELEQVLAAANVAYADLTRLAVTVGPGSFTGLRVGLATARSLALALDIPLIGTSTLEALALTAQNTTSDSPLAVLIDARRDQIYGQLFTLEGAYPAAITNAEVLSAADFAKVCRAHTVSHLIGSGASLIADQIADLPHFTIDATTAPDMQAIARWALDQPVPLTPPAPLYLRGPDAKPQAAKAIARR